MADYDIGSAFQRIEGELIAALKRNLERNIDQSEFPAWQEEQLRSLEKFRLENQDLFSERFEEINTEAIKAIQKAYENGNHTERAHIENAIANGDISVEAPTSDSFFKVNDAKLRALMEATIMELRSAETAMLRMADDMYRKIIFDSHIAFMSGSFTLRQAADMATRDFLTRGFNCIQYSNGARHCIDSYAEMALRTANKRAKLQGETAARDDYGLNTVIVTRRGVACPKCIPFCGKVFYDDVYSSVPVPDGKYPKLSSAIEGGLYHPNCKDSHSTYLKGVSVAPRGLSRAEIDEANRVYGLEQKQRYNERMIRKYKRLEAGSLDPDNQAFYASKVREWQAIQRKHIKENGDVLRRDYGREKIVIIKNKPE